MRLSLITPTCDRPVAFGLAERWMARQTRRPDEWIVADGGTTPAQCTRGQQQIRTTAPPGVESFAANLTAAARAATGDVLVVVEDDDWYAPAYLETLAGWFAVPAIQIVGDDLQRYYNVAMRRTKCFDNVGASLCQTAFRRELLPVFLEAVTTCCRQGRYGVDRALWEAVPLEHQCLVRTGTVVGIKGLPGQVGLGLGHRPTAAWTPDPDLTILQTWIGPDAAVYAPYGLAVPA